MHSLKFILLLFVLIIPVVNAQSPHGKDLKNDCSDCHKSDNWKDILKNPKFDHSQTEFELEDQHKTVNCTSCHKSLIFSKAKAKQNCFSCHKDIHQNTVGLDCESCHSQKSWLLTDIDQIHQENRFPLTGLHQAADCIQCHTKFDNLNFEPIGVNCFDCHAFNFTATTQPNHVALGYSTSCESCHTVNTTMWLVDNISHDFFPLISGHSISNCFSCHEQNKVFSSISSDCFSCHQKDFDAALNPNHKLEGFSTDCQQCHNINSFVPSTFQHNNTAFPLIGKHNVINCVDCHTNGYTVNLSIDCYSCHRTQFESTIDPNHISAGFSIDCLQCHTQNTWEPATFDHNNSVFQLQGAHISLNCSSCHSSGFSGTPTGCYSCHKNKFDTTIDPNHITAGFSTDCLQCHTQNAWKPATFDHNNSAFQLQGSHITLDCSSCHSNGFSGTPTDCYSCHKNKFDTTTDPNHVAAGYPTDCIQCHTQNAWIPATFDHNNTAFPLQGSHTTLDCSSCHSNGFSGTPTDCYSCHKNKFDTTTDPNHVIVGFPTDCIQCHTQDAWKPATFDHNNSAFPLQGSHITLDCSSCHSNGFSGTPTDCYSCHKNKFDTTTDPNHVTAGFPTDCIQCHTQDAWKPATFDHNNSAFPLTGMHIVINCVDCHTNGYTIKLSIDCYSCHRVQFESVTDPNHVVNGFSTDCSQCHSTNNWLNATFDHQNTAFPLQGAHITLDCSSCHSSGFNGTPTDCYSCHKNKFDATTDPNHVTAGFPTDCIQCHTQNAWKPATFDHNNSAFPLQGAHVSLDCSSCHSDGFKGTPTDCYLCHNEQYNSTTTPNHITSGISTDCIECHSQNNWTQASIDHGFYPLSSKHSPAKIRCEECHSQPNFQPDCWSCHSNKFFEEHKSGDPIDCWRCHKTNDWDVKGGGDGDDD